MTDIRFKGMTFTDVLVTSMQDLADRIFREAQLNVPVKSGQLKKSGSVTHYGTPNKVSVIRYTAPYASRINGTNLASTGKTARGDDMTMLIKEHRRRYPSGKTVTVKEHEKKVGSKPAGKGNGFLTKAVKKEMEAFSKTQFPAGTELIVKSM